jgi:hypothetical protein
MVPPVPTAQTNTSTEPLVSSHTLHGCTLPVHFRVSWVAELVEHDRAVDLLGKLPRSTNSISHQDAGGEHDFSTQVPKQRHTLAGH